MYLYNAYYSTFRESTSSVCTGSSTTHISLSLHCEHHAHHTDSRQWYPLSTHSVTTCDEQLVLRGGGGGQCDELVFTVEAETDVGSTGPSTNTTGGFPKGRVVCIV